MRAKSTLHVGTFPTHRPTLIVVPRNADSESRERSWNVRPVLRIDSAILLQCGSLLDTENRRLGFSWYLEITGVVGIMTSQSGIVQMKIEIGSCKWRGTGADNNKLAHPYCPLLL
jgi:hypothetical protein